MSNTNTAKQLNESLQENQMRLIERKDIPSLTSVVVDGETHQLGIVKDFRKNEFIAEFLPEVPERISFSWVRLLPGEVLSVHSHPTATLILVCDGDGYFTGDLTGPMRAGSAVLVPPNCFHGFCGAGDNGFWALSIQFESLGLYEDTNNARVSFQNQSMNRDFNINLLLDAHAFFMDDYKDNYFFSFLHSEAFKQEPIREKFLDNVQYFSSQFQKILLARLNTSTSDIERQLAEEHLEEEKDHDINLAKYRNNPTPSPVDKEIIELLAWFEDAMINRSEAEKVVLMHFVLEGSGELAHSAVYQVTKHLPVGKHFLIHQEEDDGHFMTSVHINRADSPSHTLKQPIIGTQYEI